MPSFFTASWATWAAAEKTAAELTRSDKFRFMPEANGNVRPEGKRKKTKR
jgi:hypothetical protein